MEALDIAGFGNKIKSEAEEFDFSDSKDQESGTEGNRERVLDAEKHCCSTPIFPPTSMPFFSFKGLKQEELIHYDQFLADTCVKIEKAEVVNFHETNDKIQNSHPSFPLQNECNKVSIQDESKLFPLFQSNTEGVLSISMGIESNAVSVLKTKFSTKEDVKIELRDVKQEPSSDPQDVKQLDFKSCVKIERVDAVNFHETNDRIQNSDSSFYLKNECHKLSVQNKYVQNESKISPLFQSNSDGVMDTCFIERNAVSVLKTEFSTKEDVDLGLKGIEREPSSDPQDAKSYFQLDFRSPLKIEREEGVSFLETNDKIQNSHSLFSLRNECNKLSAQDKYAQNESKISSLFQSNSDGVLNTGFIESNAVSVLKTEFSTKKDVDLGLKDIEQESSSDPQDSKSYFQLDFKCESNSTLSLKPCKILRKNVAAYPGADDILYICDDCKKSFLQKRDLKRHILKIHLNQQSQSKELKIACKFCGSSFHWRTILHRHLFLFHQEKAGELLYECYHCGNAFAKKNGLLMHMQRVHSQMKKKTSSKTNKGLNVGRFQCDSCEKSFTSKRTLQGHSAIHTGQQQVCKLCNAAFTDRSNFNRHLREVHTLKPMHTLKRISVSEDTECKICGQRFSRPWNLKRHITRKHSNNTQLYQPHPSKIKDHLDSGRPLYDCKDCSSLFYQSSHLKRHELTVHQRIKYSCKVCDKKLSDLSCLRKHLRRQHGVINDKRKVKGMKNEELSFSEND